VHLDAFRWEILVQRRDQSLWLMIVEGGVDQVHPDDSERFLLIDVRLVQHPDVDGDLARTTTRLRVDTKPQPAVRFVVLLEAACCNCVRKNKEGALVTEFLIES